MHYFGCSKNLFILTITSNFNYLNCPRSDTNVYFCLNWKNALTEKRRRKKNKLILKNTMNAIPSEWGFDSLLSTHLFHSDGTSWWWCGTNEHCVNLM